MFGLGYGRRSPLRYLRLGLLLLLILAGLLLHGHGRTYNSIHDVYLVLVLGLLGYGLFMRNQAGRRGVGRGPMGPGPMGPGASGPVQQVPPPGGYASPQGWSPPASQPVQPVAQTVQPVAQPNSPPAGWYTESGNPDHERYWDGLAWGARRHRQNGDWVVE